MECPGLTFGLAGHGAFRGLPSLILDGFESKGLEAADALSKALSSFGMNQGKASVVIRSSVDPSLVRLLVSWNVRVSSETDGLDFPEWLSCVPFRCVVSSERSWLGFPVFSFAYSPSLQGQGLADPDFGPRNSNCLKFLEIQRMDQSILKFLISSPHPWIVHKIHSPLVSVPVNLPEEDPDENV